MKILSRMSQAGVKRKYFTIHFLGNRSNQIIFRDENNENIIIFMKYSRNIILNYIKIKIIEIGIN